MVKSAMPVVYSHSSCDALDFKQNFKCVQKLVLILTCTFCV